MPAAVCLLQRQRGIIQQSCFQSTKYCAPQRQQSPRQQNHPCQNRKEPNNENSGCGRFRSIKSLLWTRQYLAYGNTSLCVEVSNPFVGVRIVPFKASRKDRRIHGIGNEGSLLSKPSHQRRVNKMPTNTSASGVLLVDHNEGPCSYCKLNLENRCEHRRCRFEDYSHFQHHRGMKTFFIPEQAEL